MFCILLILLLFNMTGIEGKCFADHKWDYDKGKCTPCPRGYFGINCAFECLPPYYGFKCTFKCDCSHHDCHHIHGCIQKAGDSSNAYGKLKSLSITTNGNYLDDSNGTTVKKDNSINDQTLTSETESWMRHVMFGIFGLAGLLFFVTVIYIYSLKHKQIKHPAVAKTP